MTQKNKHVVLCCVLCVEIRPHFSLISQLTPLYSQLVNLSRFYFHFVAVWGITGGDVDTVSSGSLVTGRHTELGRNPVKHPDKVIHRPTR